MELYLDTNFIWSFFENAIKAYRRNPKEFEELKFDFSDRMKFIKETKYNLFTSNVAKAEVYRKLISEFTTAKELAVTIWNRFIEVFSITELFIEEVEFNEIAELSLTAPLKRGTMQNLIQLQFAKNKKLKFITGDKNIKEYFSGYYKEILTYIDLRQLYGDSFPQQPS